MELKDLIKTTIQASLGDTTRLIKITSTKSGDQVSSSLSNIKKLIKKIKQKSIELDKGIEAFKIITSTVMKASLLEDLEKNFSIFEEIQSQIEVCTKAIESLKAFNPKLTGKSIKELNSLLKHSQEQYEAIRMKLFKFSKERRPNILAGKKDTLLFNILMYMQKEIKKYNKKYDSNVELGYDKSAYMAEKVPNSERIRFVRYVPVTNIPFFGDQTKDLYVAFATIFPPNIDLTNASQMEKINKKLKISITILPEVRRPSLLNELKIVDDISTAKGLLEYLFDKNNVNLFEISREGNDSARIKKHIKGTFRILDTPGVDIRYLGSTIIVKLPKSVYRKLNVDGRIEPSLEKDLLLDIQTYAGYKKNSAQGRIKLLNQKPKMLPNGYIELRYKHLELSELDISNLKGDNEDKILDDWKSDNTDWIEELRRQVSKYR